MGSRQQAYKLRKASTECNEQERIPCLPQAPRGFDPWLLKVEDILGKGVMKIFFSLRATTSPTIHDM